jgi:hypothetical protein
MSYAWGAGGAGRVPAVAPLHASVGIVQIGSGATASAVPAVMPATDAAPSVERSPAAHPDDQDRPADLELRRLAAELAPMVDVWQRLLDQHLPDRAGRCRTCTKGGTGLPSTRWPCSIHGIADLARRCHDRSA